MDRPNLESGDRMLQSQRGMQELLCRTIRRVTRGPRIDIFARRRHDGFSAWGNQVEPLCADGDLFKGDYPETKIIQLGTGELHYEEEQEDGNEPEEKLF